MRDDSEKANTVEDEIDLAQLLRIVWNKRIAIAVFVAAITVGTFFVSRQMPKVYRIDSVITPGILKINDTGGKDEFVYIDTKENIRSLIELGAFNSDIRQRLEELENKKNSDSQKIKFKVDAPANATTLKVSLESRDIEWGWKVLSELIRCLLLKYSEKVSYYKERYELDITILKESIESLKLKKKNIHAKIISYKDRISELEKEIGKITRNTERLISDQENLLRQPSNENNVLSSMLFTNSIQNNLDLNNRYSAEINEKNILIEDTGLALAGIDDEIMLAGKKIDKLAFEKNTVQNVQIVMPPTSDGDPVKPRVLFNTALAFFVSLMLGILFIIFRGSVFPQQEKIK